MMERRRRGGDGEEEEVSLLRGDREARELEPPPRVRAAAEGLRFRTPWADIARGAVFLAAGGVFAAWGVLLETGSLSGAPQHAGVVLIVAGCLLLIPGLYVAGVVAGVALGVDGVSYDDLPGAALEY